MNTTVGECGAETFAGSLHTSRSSGRKREDCLGDLCDESIKHIMNKNAVALISMTRTATGNKVRSLIISDSILNGFEGLDKEGSFNPFNATYLNPARHADDNEWSEHGKGLVDAIKAICAMCIIYTRYKKVDGDFAYEKCIWDLEAMAEENRHSPQCVTITEEEYRLNHPFETGSSIILTQLSTDIITKSFDKEQDIIEKTLVSKYSSALIEGNEGYDGSRLKFKVENNEPFDINPVPSPLENEQHPHPKYTVEMDVRTNNNNTMKILCKKHGAQTKWHAFVEADGKYKSLTNSQYEREIQRFPNHIGTFYMKGTRTSGTDYEGLPSGSLILKRLRRTLTQDYRLGGRHMSFLPTPKNGEQNYHYLEMSWIKKILTKLIEFNLRKIIDCDLTRLGSIMAEAGKWAEQQIRAAIKTESKFKKDWHREYDEAPGAEWNGGLSYEQNLNNAQLALEAYNNDQQEAESDESDEEDESDSQDEEVVSEQEEEVDNVQLDQSESHQEVNTDLISQMVSQAAEEVLGNNLDEIVDENDDTNVETEQDQNEEDSDAVSVPEFNPTEHQPLEIPHQASTHRSGIPRETYLNFVDHIESLPLSEGQKVAVSLRLKNIYKELLQIKFGQQNYNFLCGMNWMELYTFDNWINEIKNIVTSIYNGSEPSIRTGSELSALVLELNNDETQLVEEA